MLQSGDIVDIDLGVPEGREAGFRHPAVVVTAQRILDAEPSVLQVVPVTTTLRGFHSEVEIEPDETNLLEAVSAAQCQHIRSVARQRILAGRGNVGVVALSQIRDVIATILDVDS
ncbi:MAG: type II toxin-antitoxin system PemK/MazF family toxin [Ilumatobacter sp.]|uniref:type II toxin-antitoxin system PemK/MazF family toxin n=1 Tax=Ilumatobacter sp. TaxID=1967498 RepID=UPI00261502C2|nr:type II toxin-antitoxin system PemK/MazF family toxin [Ilumatobacter sp.]MDJ0770479.1 type II toxin-antitoxin system PemK/MazF family toxin [Ilumatobacter sp.]